MSYPWRLVAFLSVCGAINYADRAAMTSLLPLMRDELGMSDLGLAALGAFFLWSYALGSPFSGLFADRFSRSKLIAGSLAAWSLVTFATGFVTSVPQLLATRALLGLSESLYLPAAIALLADHHREGSRATAIGIHTAGLSFGMVAGGTAAGYLGARHGWSSAFAFLGSLGLAVAVLAAVWLRDADPDRVRPESASSGRELSRPRSPALGFIVAAALLIAVSNNVFTNWLPLYFSESHGLGLAAAGFSGTFLIQFPSVLGVMLGGPLSDRASRSEKRNRMLVQAVCYGATAPLLMVFLLKPPLWAVAATIFAFGLLKALGSVNDNSMICDLLPPRGRSRAIGLMNATNCTAGGVGVLVAGLLKSASGLGAVFAGCSLMMLLASGCVLLGYGTLARRDESLESETDAARVAAASVVGVNSRS